MGPHAPPSPAAGSGNRPTIAVSMGDPGGIGREVIAAALRDPARRASARWILLGPWDSTDHLPPDLAVRSTPNPNPHPWPRRPDAAAGESSFRAVCEACDLARLPIGHPDRADAIVTGPISKEAWTLAGHAYPGHTELLAERFGIPDGRFGMFFHAPGDPALNVILATIHIPLARVPAVLTTDRVLAAVRLGAGACITLGVANPRIAVCGLNPHAGEHGLLGAEDDAVIAPAIAAARAEGVDASGPFPGDTVFLAARRGAFDLVVAMYHDQGLIPLKLLAFDRAVNVTVGLPVPRTSPDHGTAFDIAGRGKADPGSMAAALDLAVRLAGAPA